MNQNPSVFSQIVSFIDYNDSRRCVRRYDGDRGVRRFSCWEHFLAMAFSQLTRRESLRDIEVSLAAHRAPLSRAGFRSPVKRSTLAGIPGGFSERRVMPRSPVSLQSIIYRSYNRLELGSSDNQLLPYTEPLE